jgi:hypothetical protein
MNRRFVNIKVDREQRPDLDRVYMLATQLLTGRGGWPNNVFLTPDLKPFYAGSYFPPTTSSGDAASRAVDPGYHVNANPASGPDLIPTQLTLAGLPALKVDYPPARAFKAPFAPQGIAVYEGRVSLRARLPQPLARPPAASLRVQACNDEVCLAPATVAVPIVGDGRSRAGAERTPP